MRIAAFVGTIVPVVLAASAARAQGVPTGAPPPEAKVEVTGPKGPLDAPKIAKPSTDVTNVTLSAGGLLASGNSRTLALSANGAFDMRRGDNGFAASLVTNYGESAAKSGDPMRASSENFQGRLRYDRYLNDSMSLFLIGTGRYDRFQGLAFRLNLDPGFKYIILKDDVSALWAEAGYDFQYDIRTDSGRTPKDATSAPLDRTVTDHSARVFVGYRRAFSSDVTFSTGLEFLQSFANRDIGDKDTRLNFDAILAAKLFEGFSLGVGFSARYDRLPLPGKENLDTITSLSIIYGWTDAKPKEKEEVKCPACPEPAPCPNGAPPPPHPPGADPLPPPPAGGPPPAPPAPAGVVPPPAPVPAPAPAPAPMGAAPAAPAGNGGVTITTTGGAGGATVAPPKH